MPISTTWTSGGATKKHASTRLPGPPPETDTDWTNRQFRGVWIRWQGGELPDSGTTLRTSWDGLAEPVETKDPSTTLRAWLDEHRDAAVAAQVGSPLP